MHVNSNTYLLPVTENWTSSPLTTVRLRGCWVSYHATRISSNECHWPVISLNAFLPFRVSKSTVQNPFCQCKHAVSISWNLSFRRKRPSNQVSVLTFLSFHASFQRIFLSPPSYHSNAIASRSDLAECQTRINAQSPEPFECILFRFHCCQTAETDLRVCASPAFLSICYWFPRSATRSAFAYMSPAAAFYCCFFTLSFLITI